MTFENLLGGVAPTLLPADPALEQLVRPGGDNFVQVASRHLDSSLCWAILSEGSLAAGTPDAELIAYAFARTGYHRGLDALRKNGWRGEGPVPWEHEPNRGFLRSLAMLAALSGRLGDTDEEDRCWQFLRDCSETGFNLLHERSKVPAAGVADLVRDITSADEPVNEPVVSEAVLDDSAVDEPLVDKPLGHETAVCDPAVDETAAEEPASHEPLVNETVVDEDGVERLSTVSTERDQDGAERLPTASTERDEPFDDPYEALAAPAAEDEVSSL